MRGAGAPRTTKPTNHGASSRVGYFSWLLGARPAPLPVASWQPGYVGAAALSDRVRSAQGRVARVRLRGRRQPGCQPRGVRARTADVAPAGGAGALGDARDGAARRRGRRLRPPRPVSDPAAVENPRLAPGPQYRAGMALQPARGSVVHRLGLHRSTMRNAAMRRRARCRTRPHRWPSGRDRGGTADRAPMFETGASSSPPRRRSGRRARDPSTVRSNEPFSGTSAAPVLGSR